MTETAALTAVTAARAAHGARSYPYRLAVRALDAATPSGERWCLSCLVRLAVADYYCERGRPLHTCRRCHVRALQARNRRSGKCVRDAAQRRRDDAQIGMRPVDLVPCARCGLRGHEAEACDLPLRCDPWNRRPNVNYLYVVIT